MNRFSYFALLCTLVFSVMANAQYKRESERRIKRASFPEQALTLVDPELQNARRIRYYREQDSSKTSYEVKFKRDRIFYSVEFSEEGNLEDVELLVNEIDIPKDSWRPIQEYLQGRFAKYRIKKIQQQYPVLPGTPVRKTIRNAFQNLLIQDLNYELIVTGKQGSGYCEFEILFDASGTFKSSRTSLTAPYAQIIY